MSLSKTFSDTSHSQIETCNSPEEAPDCLREEDLLRLPLPLVLPDLPANESGNNGERSLRRRLLRLLHICLPHLPTTRLKPFNPKSRVIKQAVLSSKHEIKRTPRCFVPTSLRSRVASSRAIWLRGMKNWLHVSL